MKPFNPGTKVKILKVMDAAYEHYQIEARHSLPYLTNIERIGEMAEVTGAILRENGDCLFQSVKYYVPLIQYDYECLIKPEYLELVENT